MSSKIISKEKNVIKMEFTISQEDFEKQINNAYLKMRNKINIPGFRKGKAPKRIIESRYGKEVFYEDALDLAIPGAYSKAVDENKLDVIDQPKIDVKEFEEGKEIVVTADVEVMPEVKLCAYKGIEVEKVEYNVTEEDIENELKKTREQNARIIEVSDRSIEKGDTLTIDYEGCIEGEQFEGGTAENQTLEIGSNSFIPGFEDQLIGKEKDEEVEVKVTFPDEYQAEELKGKDAVFKVKIHEIKSKELPSLDDEFAKDVSEFDTLDELKQDTKKKLESKAKENEKTGNENNAVTKVVKESVVDVPEILVDREVDYQARMYEQQLKSQGFDTKDMADFIKTIVDQYKDNVREQSGFNARTELVLSEIIKAESIVASDEEIENEIKKMVEAYKVEEDKVEDFIKNMKDSNGDYFKDMINKRIAVELIVDNASFIEAVNKEEVKEEEVK